MTSRSKNITDYRSLEGNLSDDKTTYTFPDVQTVGRLKNTYHWQIRVHVIVGDNHENYIPIDDSWFDSKNELPPEHYGYYIVDKWIGDGGTHDVEPTIIKDGKNKGRSNCTNPFTQALSEAYSLRLKYIDRNAKNKTNGDVVLYPPMLAKKRSDVEVIDDMEFVFPDKHYQQRKYDGVRAIITLTDDRNGVIIYSRQLKEYKQFSHLREEAHQFLIDGETVCGDKLYIDGEMYKHGKNLQDISGAARRKNSKQKLQLEFHCYDCFIPTRGDMIYTDRKAILDELFEFPENYTWIKSVETWSPTTEQEVNEYHQFCLDDGYEGSMIRLDKPYEYSYKGYHCSHLLKIKPKLDAEFAISGFFAAEKGKAKGCLMWKCKVVNDKGEEKEFNITPMGTLDERKQLYIKLQELDPISPTGDQTLFQRRYYNKPLTVKFDDYSNDGVPIRGNAVAIRDYE